MTTPIPEAAVEAAARALRDIASQVDETSDDLPEDYISEACVIAGKVTCIHGSPELIARATLTAALPLIEAEIRGQVAADCRVEAENVDLEVPNAYREGTRDGYLSAATIAERTQR